MDKCPSGLRSTPRKRVRANPLREFESRLIRQYRKPQPNGCGFLLCNGSYRQSILGRFRRYRCRLCASVLTTRISGTALPHQQADSPALRMPEPCLCRIGKLRPGCSLEICFESVRAGEYRIERNSSRWRRALESQSIYSPGRERSADAKSAGRRHTLSAVDPSSHRRARPDVGLRFLSASLAANVALSTPRAANTPSEKPARSSSKAISSNTSVSISSLTNAPKSTLGADAAASPKRPASCWAV